MNLLKSPKRIVLLSLGLLMILVASVSFLFVKEIGFFGDDMMYVPVYPNAQQVQVNIGTNVPMTNTLVPPYKKVTFVTADTPDQVLAYYKDHFVLHSIVGLREYAGLPNTPPGSLTLDGHQHDERHTWFMFEVKTELKGGLTQVIVYLINDSKF